MNWDNYGPYFHIDHIIPCNVWDLTNDLELKRTSFSLYKSTTISWTRKSI